MNSKRSQLGILFVMALLTLVLTIPLAQTSQSRANRSMQRELSILGGG